LNRTPHGTVLRDTCFIRVPKDGTMSPHRTAMLRADELTVVHHDDSVSRFTDVTYTLSRGGLRVLTANGDERTFAGDDVLTTHVRRDHGPTAA
jgi:hypothetical protein